MDSQVLRLIRRYDLTASDSKTNVARPKLENTRGIWHTVSTNSNVPILTTKSSPLLSRRALTTSIEEHTPIISTSTPRLQRQEAIQENDVLPTTPTVNLRPILKYSTTRSRSELHLSPNKNEALNIDVDSGIPSPSPSPSPIPVVTSINQSNESPIQQQNFLSTGSKRICSALSKSELDLRLQRDSPPVVPPLPFPVRPPSPPNDVLYSPQERDSSLSSLTRNKSSLIINNNSNEREDNFDEMSAPIISSTGSYVEKLKQLLVRKSSIDTNQSPIIDINERRSSESNLERRSKPVSIESTSVKSPSVPNTIEPPPRTVFNHNYFPRTVQFDEINLISSSPSSLVKKPIFRSQKTIDDPETVSRSSIYPTMNSSELSHDAYRFHRSIEQDSNALRVKNVAKVEPYSINSNTIRPTYPTGISNQSTSTTIINENNDNNHISYETNKARIPLNNNEQTSTNISPSSALSLPGMIRHSNVLQSDFLIPNPAYLSKHSPFSFLSAPSSKLISHPTPEMLVSESLEHGQSHQLSTTDTFLHNNHRTIKSDSTENARQTHRPLKKLDLTNNLPVLSHPISQEHWNNHHQSNPVTSYHYRPATTSKITNSNLNNTNQQRTTFETTNMKQILNERQDDLNQTSRRRFHKRKQMKRSKSVDLSQDPSSNPMIHPSVYNENSKISRQQRTMSREFLSNEGHLSPLASSSSSSSIGDIERVNQAVLLRHKSLDSMTVQNRTSQGNNRDNHRRALSKPVQYDFDSDDSVCGIPKPRRTIGR